VLRPFYIGHTGMDCYRFLRSFYFEFNVFIPMGSSIYDVHTEGRGQVQVNACGRGDGGQLHVDCGRPHRKL